MDSILHQVQRFANMSKAESGCGGSYGHSWKPTVASELLKFDGVLVMNGVLGSTTGALYRRWDNKSSCFSEDIYMNMNPSRFKELKEALKLCHNGSEPKRGQDGYDPGYKYDLVYRSMVHNTNGITLFADENQTLDETTWGHGGYGEAKSGLVSRLWNKKVSKGGQTVIVSDGRKYFRPRAYQHRHKLHPMPSTVKLTRQGTREVHDIATMLLRMMISDENSYPGVKKVFRAKPCITMDNYFIDDAILKWLGDKGLGCIGTNARNVLPKDISPEYLCTKKLIAITLQKWQGLLIQL